MLTALHRRKLMENKTLVSMARTSAPQTFAGSIFPKAFGDAAMRALAKIIYREVRKEL